MVAFIDLTMADSDSSENTCVQVVILHYNKIWIMLVICKNYDCLDYL